MAQTSRRNLASPQSGEFTELAVRCWHRIGYESATEWQWIRTGTVTA